MHHPILCILGSRIRWVPQKCKFLQSCGLLFQLSISSRSAVAAQCQVLLCVQPTLECQCQAPASCSRLTRLSPPGRGGNIGSINETGCDKKWFSCVLFDTPTEWERPVQSDQDFRARPDTTRGFWWVAAALVSSGSTNRPSIYGLIREWWKPSNGMYIVTDTQGWKNPPT